MTLDFRSLSAYTNFSLLNQSSEIGKGSMTDKEIIIRHARRAPRLPLGGLFFSRLLKKAHLRISQHRLGGVLPAGGVSQDRCHSSLGERAPLRQAQCGEQSRTVGCGRWSSALTEPFRLYVRSLTRAPLGRSVKRGGLASDPKAPVVQVQRTHRSIAFGKRVGSRANPLLWAREAASRETLLLSAREASARTNLFDQPVKRVFQHFICLWIRANGF